MVKHQQNMTRFLMHVLLCLGMALSLPLPVAAQVVQPSSIKLQVTELNNSLQSPWGLAFLPDGRMLVTERKGTLKLLNANGQMLALIQGVPEVNAEGQGGLMDVVLDPAFAVNQRIYLTFSESDANNTNRTCTAVLRASLNVTESKLKDGVVIYRQIPKVNSSGHFGSRLVFDRNGHLFITLGDRQSRSERVHAQDLSRGNGKVVRITTEGKSAPANPQFAERNAQIGIWSYGHRNPQGAALHPTTGELWVSEHGPQGGDEINRVLAGKNYGWPVISHGQEYGISIQVSEGSAKAGMEQPVVVWLTRDGSPHIGLMKSSIAPSGLAFYTGDKFPEYRGNLFSGALAGTALWRIVLNPDHQTEQSRERLLANLGERIRDVRQGPDGWLSLLTDSGKLLRAWR